ncbi:MAG TPA: hypothetical protein VHN77_12640 [Phycisphaerales bacterium]|nr:hypothetical protein [Phycisphaerales bacterium]
MSVLLLHFEGDFGGGSGGRDWHAMLDPYVDGMLTREDAAAFESRLHVDPALRAALESQRALDASLRASFLVPHGVESLAVPALDGAIPAGASGGKSILARIGWMRIAALVAIVALGALVVGMRQWARTAYPVESPITAYQSIVHGGFRPYEACTDDEEFARYTKKYLGRALIVKSFPGLALIGWDNRHNVMSIETDSLLATVDGVQVVVFMDREENARSLPRRGEGLNVFKRTVAGIVLVEVTPLKEAKVLPGFEETTSHCEPGK